MLDAVAEAVRGNGDALHRAEHVDELQIHEAHVLALDHVEYRRRASVGHHTLLE